MRAGAKGASPGNLSLLILIIKAVALMLFRSRYVALPFDKPRLIENHYHFSYIGSCMQ